MKTYLVVYHRNSFSEVDVVEVRAYSVEAAEMLALEADADYWQTVGIFEIPLGQLDMPTGDGTIGQLDDWGDEIPF